MMVTLEGAHDLSEYIIRALDNSPYYENSNLFQFAGQIGMLVQNVEDDLSILKDRLFPENESIKSLIPLTNGPRLNPHHTSKRAILMATFAYVKTKDIIETQGNSPDTAEMLCEVLTLVIRGDYAKSTDGIFVDTPELRKFIDKVFFQLCEWQHFHIAAEVLYAYKKLI